MREKEDVQSRKGFRKETLKRDVRDSNRDVKSGLAHAPNHNLETHRWRQKTWEKACRAVQSFQVWFVGSCHANASLSRSASPGILGRDVASRPPPLGTVGYWGDGETWCWSNAAFPISLMASSLSVLLT